MLVGGYPSQIDATSILSNTTLMKQKLNRMVGWIPVWVMLCCGCSGCHALGFHMFCMHSSSSSSSSPSYSSGSSSSSSSFCTQCGGQGRVKRQDAWGSDASGQLVDKYHWEVCTYCRGTGVR